MEQRILIIDPARSVVVSECSGPDVSGRCPRVAAGEVVPCGGATLAPAGQRRSAPFAVPLGETICPITLAMALAASPDAAGAALR